MDVFSRRFQYRIGSGLYDKQLQLHDFEAVGRFLKQRRGEIGSVTANEQVTLELVLRHQVRVAVTQSLGGRGAGTLPDGPRMALADLYEQVGNPLASVIKRPSLDWLMPPATPDATQSIQPPNGEPVCADRFAMWSCVLLMDYVEMHYAALADSVKTEFARDLNSRLANGRSPWMLVMGRWRREGWPADRDSPFDAVPTRSGRRPTRHCAVNSMPALAKTMWSAMKARRSPPCRQMPRSAARKYRTSCARPHTSWPRQTGSWIPIRR